MKCKAVEMTARAKGKVRRGEVLNLLASILSVEQEIKRCMEEEVNRGKGGNFFLSKGKAENDCYGKRKME